MLAELTFDEASHTYRFGGRLVPSVTQILAMLNDFSSVHPMTLELARTFGTHVHSAVEMYIKGELDEESLDPALRPYLDGWIAFQADTGFEVIESECRLISTSPLYAGTADVVGRMKSRLAVIDVKSGMVPKTVGPQTAAYAHAHPLKPKDRYCLALSPDGYKLHPCKDAADFAVFSSCLNIFNWRNKHVEH